MPGLTFPQNPSDGQTVSFSFQHTGGDANNAVVTKTWSWNESKNSWISNSSGVAGSDRFVLKAGDTMSGDLTTTRAFRTNTGSFTSNEFVTKSYVDTFNPSGNYVLKTGDTMSGTLTGTNASFAKSVIVTNSGSYENQPFLTIAKVGGTNAGYAGINPGTTAFMDLPRLVLNNFSNNSWGWPKAIDFMTRPTAGDQNAVIGWRIGDSYNTSGKSFLTFWGAPSRIGSSQQTVGISAGLSGEGLTALGYFQVGVGRDDNGLYTEKSFRTSSDPEFLTDEFVTRQFFTDNEYRLSRQAEGDNKIKHFNLYITYQKGGVAGAYQSWASSAPWAKSIYTEVGQGTTGYYNVNGHNYESEYHDLTEEKVGFPKPWAVHVKKSFWRSSLQQQNESRDGPRYYAPHGPRAQSVSNPAFYVCDSRSFQTSRDIRIRHIGFKNTNDKGGPDTNTSGLTADISQYVFYPALGVDFPAVGASDGGYARIKLSTFIEGGYPILLGDTFINEIHIVPG